MLRRVHLLQIEIQIAMKFAMVERRDQQARSTVMMETQIVELDLSLLFTFQNINTLERIFLDSLTVRTAPTALCQTSALKAL